MSEKDIFDAISKLRDDIKRIERSINGRRVITLEEQYPTPSQLTQKDNRNILSQLDKIITLLESIDKSLKSGIKTKQ